MKNTNKKSGKRVVVIALSILVVLGIVSNIVEKNIDKEAVKEAVTTHLVEE